MRTNVMVRLWPVIFSLKVADEIRDFLLYKFNRHLYFVLLCNVPGTLLNKYLGIFQLGLYQVNLVFGIKLLPADPWE